MRCRWSSRGCGAQGRVVRVEDPVDGAVALGMDTDLPAGAVGAGDGRPEVVLRRPVQRPGELAVGPVGRGERRGAAGQCAVGVELHRPDRQPVVTEPPGQPDRLVLVELRRDRHRRDPDTEQASFARGPVAGELAPGDLRVHDRGDAGRERRPAATVDVGHDLLERRVVVEPRAVVADVHRRRDDELLRGVEAVAGQAALLVADEVTALWIGDVVGQAPPLEAEAVGQGVVTAHVLDQHRMDACRLVEVPARREAAVAEQLRVHADGADPLAVGRPFGGLGDPRDEVVDGRHAGIPRVDRGQLRAGEGEVVMGVDETRQDGPASDVDGSRVGWSRCTQRGLAADRDDPIADDGHAAAERRLARPGREHASVEQDQSVHRPHLRTGPRANHVHCSRLDCGLRCIRPDEGARHGADAARKPRHGPKKEVRACIDGQRSSLASRSSRSWPVAPAVERHHPPHRSRRPAPPVAPRGSRRRATRPDRTA